MSGLDEIGDFCGKYRHITYTIWLYAGNELFCKVGYSRKFDDRRIELAAGFPVPPCYYFLIASDSYQEARLRERFFHDALNPINTRGEWFSTKDPSDLIGAWASTYGLLVNIAHAKDEPMSQTAISADWGHYGRNDNPIGAMICYTISQYIKPLSVKGWKKVLRKLDKNYGKGWIELTRFGVK